MADKTRFRQLWFAILGLLIVNLGVLLWLWLPVSGPGKRPHQPPMLAELVKELDLDQQQKAKLDALVAQHFAEVDPIRDSIRILKSQLFELLPNDTLNDSQLDSLCTSIAQKMARTDRMVFRHFQEIRSLCTKEQQAKFDRIIGGLIQPPGGAGGPHPPPPPPFPKK